MFSFAKEQKELEISNIRLGGQPGFNPTVLFGGLFFKGKPDYDKSKGFLKKMTDISKKTSIPGIPDFFYKKRRTCP